MAKFSSIVEKVLAILLIGGPVVGSVGGEFIAGRYEINRGIMLAIGLIVGLAISILLLVLLVGFERLLMRRHNASNPATNDVTEEGD